jgi:hypothetical protein
MKSAFHTIGSEKGTVVSPLLSYMHVLSLPTTLRSRIIIMPFSRLRFFISFASFLFNGCKFTHFPRNTQTIRNFFSLYPFRLLFLSSFSLFAFRFPLYFRTFDTVSRRYFRSTIKIKKMLFYFVLFSLNRTFAS